MYTDYFDIKEEIIDFLIIHQPYIKSQLVELAHKKDAWLQTTKPAFRDDLMEQYEARVNQWISFYAAEYLGVPVENVIIELERIDVNEYLRL